MNLKNVSNIYIMEWMLNTWWDVTCIMNTENMLTFGADNYTNQPPCHYVHLTTHPVYWSKVSSYFEYNELGDLEYNEIGDLDYNELGVHELKEI